MTYHFINLKKISNTLICVILPCLLSGCPSGDSSSGYKSNYSYKPTSYSNFNDDPNHAALRNPLENKVIYCDRNNGNYRCYQCDGYHIFAIKDYSACPEIKKNNSELEGIFNSLKKREWPLLEDWQKRSAKNARDADNPQPKKNTSPAPKITLPNKYVKKYSDFKACSAREVTSETTSESVPNKEYCTLGDDEYLIKKFDAEKYTVREILADFVGAFILHGIDKNIAPVNYLVVDNEGNLMGLASKIIKDFTTRASFYDTQAKKNPSLEYCRFLLCSDYLYPICMESEITKVMEQLCYSEEIVKANILANFINQVDYHHNNVGFVVDKEGNIVHSSLVDFSFSLDTQSSVKKLLPSTRYFGNLKIARDTLCSIQNWSTKPYLDELKDLFSQLGETKTLEEIKNLINKNLENIKKQLKVVEAVNYILDNQNNSLEDIDSKYFQILKTDIDVLTNITSYDDSNVLINFLCDKENPLDIKYLVEILNNNPNLLPSCAQYCLNQKKDGLLKALVDKLDASIAESLLQAVVKKSTTIEHLKLTAVPLLQRLNNRSELYDKHISLLKEAIQNLRQTSASNYGYGEQLMRNFYEQETKKEYGFTPYDFYDQINKLIKLWLSSIQSKDIEPLSTDALCQKHEIDEEGYIYSTACTLNIFWGLFKEKNILGMRNWFIWIKNSPERQAYILSKLVKHGDKKLLQDIFAEYDKNKLTVIYSKMDEVSQKSLSTLLNT